MRSIRQSIVLCLALFMSAGLSAETYHVDDDAPNDPGPGDPSVSDPQENGSEDHPFDAIQEGIDVAVSVVDDVLVKDGTYTGAGNKNINFGGKAITVQSENGADVWFPYGTYQLRVQAGVRCRGPD